MKVNFKFVLLYKVNETCSCNVVLNDTYLHLDSKQVLIIKDNGHVTDGFLNTMQYIESIDEVRYF